MLPPDLSPPSVAALELRGISHAFERTPVLDEVSLSVATGELVCLVGPSGCGKTTLLRLAAGLEELQAGDITIHGSVVASAAGSVPPESRGVGLVFQDYALFPHLDIAANVAFGLTHRPAHERALAVGDVLARVGMVDHARAYPHQLSGGQQQRVALARALAPRPRVLLLDEPFSGLDARLREKIRDDTLHVIKQSGAAALMVTHDPEEAMFMADRLAIMRMGRIEQAGPPAEVYSNPGSAFVAAIFGQLNELHGRVERGEVATRIGRIPVSGFADGTKVRVLVRPEALTLGSVDSEGSTPAKVLASRLLGRSSWIHLCIGREQVHAGPHADDDHIHARIPGRVLPAEGEILGLRLDLAQVFVFAWSG